MSRRNAIPVWWSLFITEYMKNNENGLQAMLKVKPNLKPTSAAVCLDRLLKNDSFTALMAKAKGKLESKVEMTREEWMRGLADVARFDIRKFLKQNGDDIGLSDDWQDRPEGHVLERVQMKTTTLESGQVVTNIDLSAAPKLKSFEIIGKAMGYLTEKVDVTSDGKPMVIMLPVKKAA